MIFEILSDCIANMIIFYHSKIKNNMLDAICYSKTQILLFVKFDSC